MENEPISEEDARQLVTDALAGEIDDAGAAALERYRQGHAEFAAEEERLRKAWTLLGELRESDLQAPAMSPRLRDAIHAADAASNGDENYRNRRDAFIRLLLARAGQDPDFRRQLLKRPREFFEQLLGEALPANFDAQAPAGKCDTVILTFPHAIPEDGDALDTVELDMVAGGSAESPVSDDYLRRHLLEMMK